jgi:hypothetical protein
MPERLPIIDTTPRDAFLALFETRHARTLTEIFLLCGPRAGIVMPADIMGAVVYHLRGLISASEDPAQQEDWREILLIAAEHWELAEAFGDYCVRYSALPESFRLVLDGKDKPAGLLAAVQDFAPTDAQAAHARDADHAHAAAGVERPPGRIGELKQIPVHDRR